MPDDSTLANRLRLAYLVLALAYMGWAMWSLMVPAHRQAELRMKLLRSSAQAMSRLARRAGVASMHRELTTGAEQYGVPYRLALARIALDRAYDRARGAVT
jgi:hypothetical protein